MVALVMPCAERSLLKTVQEQIAAEPVRDWPSQSLKLCLNFLRALRKSTLEARCALEAELQNGAEARAFARAYGRYATEAAEHLHFVQQLIDDLATADDESSRELLAELHRLKKEKSDFHSLLAQGLALANAPPRPADSTRVQAAEQSHDRGETKPFNRK
jgi:hypothetical protein